MCGGFKKREMCPCGSGRFVEFLCDHPTGRRKTCSQPMCDQCVTVTQHADRHLCRDHAAVLPAVPTGPSGPSLPALACGCAG